MWTLDEPQVNKIGERDSTTGRDAGVYTRPEAPVSEPPAIRGILRFDDYVVDPRSGELHKSGHKIKLQEQPFQILTILLEHPGEVVTREELCRKLWPQDTFVDFDHSLNTAIKKLRQALHDEADEPRFIETLPRRGYRFVGSMKEDQLQTQLQKPQQPSALATDLIGGVFRVKVQVRETRPWGWITVAAGPAGRRGRWRA
jgi:DNA-binding winged helix-turn-helix (wHTH) protein